MPGYRFASWEQGYGDFHLVPDLGTLRVASWLDSTALVLCDVHDTKTHEPVAVAPRSILRRQVDAARELGFDASWPPPSSSTTSSARRYRDAAASGYRDLEPGRLVPRGLPPPPGHAHRGLPRRGPPPPEALRRAGRELEGRVGPRPARAERPLRRGARDGRPPHRLQAVPEGDRRPAGRQRHLHGQVAADRPARAATSTSACGATARTRSPATSSSDRSQCSDEFRWFLGGWLAHVPELMPCSTRRRSTPTSATSTARGRRRGSPGATTTAPPASASSATDRACASSAASPAPTATPTSPSPASLASGLDGNRRTASSRRDCFDGDVYAARTCRACRAPCAEATELFARERVRQARLRRRGRRALRPLLPHRAGRLRRAPSPTGSGGATSRGSDDGGTGWQGKVALDHRRRRRHRPRVGAAVRRARARRSSPSTSTTGDGRRDGRARSRRAGGRAIARATPTCPGPPTAKRMVAAAEEAFGRLDVLFNNAGIMHAATTTPSPPTRRSGT